MAMRRCLACDINWPAFLQWRCPICLGHLALYTKLYPQPDWIDELEQSHYLWTPKLDPKKLKPIKSLAGKHYIIPRHEVLLSGYRGVQDSQILTDNNGEYYEVHGYDQEHDEYWIERVHYDGWLSASTNTEQEQTSNDLQNDSSNHEDIWYVALREVEAHSTSGLLMKMGDSISSSASFQPKQSPDDNSGNLN